MMTMMVTRMLDCRSWSLFGGVAVGILQDLGWLGRSCRLSGRCLGSLQDMGWLNRRRCASLISWRTTDWNRMLLTLLGICLILLWRRLGILWLRCLLLHCRLGGSWLLSLSTHSSLNLFEAHHLSSTRC
jgi:hypothetical protein